MVKNIYLRPDNIKSLKWLNNLVLLKSQMTLVFWGNITTNLTIPRQMPNNYNNEHGYLKRNYNSYHTFNRFWDLKFES